MKKKIRFLNLAIEDADQRNEILKAVEGVLKHGRLIMGPEVSEFETRFAAYCDRKFAVGVNSGTDALFLGLKSLGVGPGDEVITTSLSWIATANAIALTGAVPVFADICDDLNIDPESIKRLVSAKTKVILPVHFTGKVCQMDEILQIAEKEKIIVVEDAAQAFGARYKNKTAGSFGKIACFSMNPMKVLAACGEAGMVVLDDDKIYDNLIALRYNGTINKETCLFGSLNGRIDTLQAAILLKRFETVENIIRKRKEIAKIYDEELHQYVTVPHQKDCEDDAYYSYTIRVDNRTQFQEYLASEGIETKIQHPILMPKQPAYCDGVVGEWLNAEKMVGQILCLPSHEKMVDEEIKYVVEVVNHYFDTIPG